MPSLLFPSSCKRRKHGDSEKRIPQLEDTGLASSGASGETSACGTAQFCAFPAELHCLPALVICSWENQIWANTTLNSPPSLHAGPGPAQPLRGTQESLSVPFQKYLHLKEALIAE